MPITSVIIGTDELVKMAGEAFKQEQYGKVDVAVVASRKEVLEIARNRLK